MLQTLSSQMHARPPASAAWHAPAQPLCVGMGRTHRRRPATLQPCRAEVASGPSIQTTTAGSEQPQPLQQQQQQEQHPVTVQQLQQQQQQMEKDPLVAQWWSKARALGELASDNATPNRRPRMAALRSEMAALQAQMAPAVSQALEDHLVALRAANSRARKERLAAAAQTGPFVVVDCSHSEQYCRPGLETRSLVKQIESSMSYNRKSAKPLGLHVTSWGGEAKQFGDYIGSQGWTGITLHEADLFDIFPSKEQVVMLSPDAEEPLLQLEQGKVYVVGGIVDRSVRKGVTRGFAAENGIQARRLPIQEHAEQLGIAGTGVWLSPVLNVSDVVIGLVKFQETGDWVQTLDAIIPERKRRPQAPRPKKHRYRQGKDSLSQSSSSADYDSGSVSGSESGGEGVADSGAGSTSGGGGR